MAFSGWRLSGRRQTNKGRGAAATHYVFAYLRVLRDGASY